MNQKLPYTSEDEKILHKLECLHDEWQKVLQKNGADEDTLKLYVSDGIFPGYSEQKVKILFIGREALDIAGCDYAEILFDGYKNKRIGYTHLNSHKFHSLMLRVVYGLNNEYPEWKTIPMASEIADTFGEQGGISFAFMNLSKFSNESGAWQADAELIDEFVRKSENETNLFAKEISIINPDIIIGMNLGGQYYDTIGLRVGPFKFFGNNDAVCLQNLATKFGTYPLIDTYHFSALRKKKKEDFYDPIIEAFKHYINSKNNS